MMTNTTKRVFLHHADNDARAYGTVRLSRAQYDALRASMRTPVGEVRIRFDHGVHMTPTGFGWYRLYTTNEFRAVDKLKTAIQTLITIVARHNRMIENAVRGIITTQTPVVAFTHDGGYQHAIVMREKPVSAMKAEHVRVPTNDRLQALVAKYAKR